MTSGLFETRRKDYRPISAVITTLATHAYLKVVEESKLAPLSPIDAILKIVEKMRDYVRHINGEYQVLNPKDAGENFSEKWNRPDEGHMYSRAFYDWHASAVVSFQLGLQSHDSADSFARAMEASFGIGQKIINDANREIPGHWTMPGRKAGMTRNAVSLGALSGSASHASTQSNVKPVERLG